MTKIAHAILYMLDKEVLHLNDKKLCVLLFLMDHAHMQEDQEKIFGDTYIKAKRSPEPKILSEIFDIIANEEDLEEDDERLFIIQELLDYLDIEMIKKEKFIELKFIKMEESFDSELFEQSQMKVLRNTVKKYKETTARNLANETFNIQKVRETPLGETII